MSLPFDPPSTPTLRPSGNHDPRQRVLAAAELRIALGGSRGQIIDTGYVPPPPPSAPVP
jgi:hypothetical protein